LYAKTNKFEKENQLALTSDQTTLFLETKTGKKFEGVDSAKFLTKSKSTINTAKQSSKQTNKSSQIKTKKNSFRGLSTITILLTILSISSVFYVNSNFLDTQAECKQLLQTIELDFEVKQSECDFSLENFSLQQSNQFLKISTEELEKYNLEFKALEKEVQQNFNQAQQTLSLAKDFKALEKEKTIQVEGILWQTQNNNQIGLKQKNQDLIDLDKELNYFIEQKYQDITSEISLVAEKDRQLKDLTGQNTGFISFWEEKNFLLETSPTDSDSAQQILDFHIVSQVKLTEIEQKKDKYKLELIQRDDSKRTGSGDLNLEELQAVSLTAEMRKQPEEVNCQIQKCVALSFDDGPHSELTAKLLNELQKRNIKATFYVVGTRLESNKNLLQRMIDEGHEIGNHTYNHPNLTKLSEDEIRLEIDSVNNFLRDNFNLKPDTFRPPYGAVNQQVVDQVGLPSIKWTVDPKDWRDRNSELVAKRIVKDTQDRDIILLHDIHPTSVDAAILSMDTLLDKGFVFVTVHELLTMPDSRQLENKIYFNGINF